MNTDALRSASLSRTRTFSRSSTRACLVNDPTFGSAGGGREQSKGEIGGCRNLDRVMGAISDHWGSCWRGSCVSLEDRRAICGELERTLEPVQTGRQTIARRMFDFPHLHVRQRSASHRKSRVRGPRRRHRPSQPPPARPLHRKMIFLAEASAGREKKVSVFS